MARPRFASILDAQGTLRCVLLSWPQGIAQTDVAEGQELALTIPNGVRDRAMVIAKHESPADPTNSTPTIRNNRATRTIASTLAVLVGVGSMDHGLLECLQGFRPTQGLIVNALGPGYRCTV